MSTGGAGTKWYRRKPAHFLQGLRLLLSPACDDLRHLLFWTPSGLSFVVVDPDLLIASGALQTRAGFKHNNFPSVVRQLNMYGFHKHKTSCGASQYTHPLFKRDRPDLVGQIVRRVPPALGQVAPPKPADVVDALVTSREIHEMLISLPNAEDFAERFDPNGPAGGKKLRKDQTGAKRGRTDLDPVVAAPRSMMTTTTTTTSTAAGATEYTSGAAGNLGRGRGRGGRGAPSIPVPSTGSSGLPAASNMNSGSAVAAAAAMLEAAHLTSGVSVKLEPETTDPPGSGRGYRERRGLASAAHSEALSEAGPGSRFKQEDMHDDDEQQGDGAYEERDRFGNGAFGNGAYGHRPSALALLATQERGVGAVERSPEPEGGAHGPGGKDPGAASLLGSQPAVQPRDKSCSTVSSTSHHSDEGCTQTSELHAAAANALLAITADPGSAALTAGAPPLSAGGSPPMPHSTPTGFGSVSLSSAALLAQGTGATAIKSTAAMTTTSTTTTAAASTVATLASKPTRRAAPKPGSGAAEAEVAAAGEALSAMSAAGGRGELPSWETPPHVFHAAREQVAAAVAAVALLRDSFSGQALRLERPETLRSIADAVSGAPSPAQVAVLVLFHGSVLEDAAWRAATESLAGAVPRQLVFAATLSTQLHPPSVFEELGMSSAWNARVSIVLKRTAGDFEGGKWWLTHWGEGLDPDTLPLGLSRITKWLAGKI